MYRDHLQDWLDYGYLFVDVSYFGDILTKWNRSDLGFLGFWSCSVDLPPLWFPFDWNWSYFRFLSIIWRTCGSKCPGGQTLCVKFCLVSYAIDISKLIFNVAHATWLSLHGTVIWLLCGKDTIKQDDCFVPKCVTSNCRRLVGGRFISSIHQIRKWNWKCIDRIIIS